MARLAIPRSRATLNSVSGVLLRTHARVLLRRYSTAVEDVEDGRPTVPLKESIVPFVLADIGEGITEVEILKWHVSAGDSVREFDPLVDVQSDKATVDITSRYDGVIDSLEYDVGDTAIVGKPLCFIRSPQGGIATVDHDAVNEEPQDEGKGLALALPSVRRLAKEHGLDLSTIRATGKGGRVTKEDVYEHLNSAYSAPVTDTASADTSAATPAASTLPPEMWTPRGRQEPFHAPDTEVQSPPVPRVEKVRGLQRAMVKSMTASALIPQLGLGEEISMDALHDLRATLKPLVGSISDPTDGSVHPLRLTYLPFFIKAASLALTDFPVLNSTFDAASETLTYHDTHNISVAMDTREGLVTPNVKHVERLSIVGISKELARLGQEAERGRFTQADLAGGTFALSNIGSIAGTYTHPVVMPPQVAIGALGRMRMAAVVKRSSSRDDAQPELGVGRVLHVSWAADHRVVDGATMANFSNAWKKYVEEPHRMLLHLK